jgi:hypothetical protein
MFMETLDGKEKWHIDGFGLDFTYYKDGKQVTFEAAMPANMTLEKFNESITQILDQLEQNGEIDEETTIRFGLSPFNFE